MRGFSLSVLLGKVLGYKKCFIYRTGFNDTKLEFIFPCSRDFSQLVLIIMCSKKLEFVSSFNTSV